MKYQRPSLNELFQCYDSEDEADFVESLLEEVPESYESLL